MTNIIKIFLKSNNYKKIYKKNMSSYFKSNINNKDPNNTKNNFESFVVELKDTREL